MSFVPPEFDVPTTVDRPDFHVRVLSPRYAIIDYEAVALTKPHMPRIFVDQSWPAEVVDFETNLKFIREDFDDFRARRGFSYILLDPKEQRCHGCLYIFPSFYGDYDAAVYFWVHYRLMRSTFEQNVYQFARIWLQEVWPFQHAAFPGREIPWRQWVALPRKKAAY